MTTQEAADPALLKLQAGLCGFEVTGSHSASKTIRALRHCFRVRFLGDPGLEADLVLEFLRRAPGSAGARTENQEGQGFGLTAPDSPRTLSLDVQLSRRWLLGELSQSGFLDIVREKKSASMLLSRIVSYLEHDQKRRAFLSRYPVVDVQVDEQSSTMHVRVPLLKTDSHRSSIYASLKDREIHWLNLSWEWSWMTGKESLRVTQPHPGTKQIPTGIDELVELTGSCEDAICLILNLPAVKDTAAKSEGDPQGFVGENESEDYENEPAADLSEYEMLRLERIKRNEQRLKELGLDAVKPPLPEASSRKRPRR
jgi:hypothetical protein